MMPDLFVLRGDKQPPEKSGSTFLASPHPEHMPDQLCMGRLGEIAAR